MRRIRRGAIELFLAAGLLGGAGAQAPAPPPTSPSIAELYAHLAGAQLNPTRVYRVDGLDIDDEDVHISLIHGTLGLLAPTEGVSLPGMGGAIFAGQGEILVMPPDAADRLAMANFTGAAILDEQFNSAYFRFTDGALRLAGAELAEPLPADAEAQAFVAQWKGTATSLNQTQGLRLLAEVLNHGRTPYFYARIGGEHLGPFQVLVDRSLPEQVSITGEDATKHGFADVWASFRMRTARAGPPEASRDPDEIQVESYRVRSDIGADLSLRGEAVVSFRARVGGDQVLAFDLASGLHLESVTDETGRQLDFVQFGVLHDPARPPAPPRAGSSPVVAAILAAPLAVGRKYQLRFRYGGRIIFAAAHGLYALADRADWYPNRPGQPAAHDLTFTYPAALTLVATGAKTAVPPGAAPLPAGYARSHWLSLQPLALAGFNLGIYQEAEAEATSPQGPVEIRVYGAKAPPPLAAAVAGGGPSLAPSATSDIPPAPTAAQLAQVARKTARNVEFYEQRFGPMPYRRLAVTELPMRLGQGWPGLLYLATDSFLSPAQLEDLKLPTAARTQYPLMRPHEIAHQWWGDEVGWHDYHDQWLPEALATYSSLLYLESQPGGEAAMHAVLEQERQALLQRNAQGQEVQSAGPIWLGVRLDSGRFPNAYDTIIYDKGSWILHMIREMLRSPEAGDAPAPAGSRNATAFDPRDARFFALLQDFLRTYAGKTPSTADFERVAERHWPAALDLTQDGNLDWFFREWVDWTGVPRYEVIKEHWLGRGARQRLAGVLAQEQVPGGFLMPVPLYLRANGQLRYLGTVAAQGPRTAFAFSLPAGWPSGGAPPPIAIDPNDTILKR